jgi:threonine dehydrogenase-like Zn-dependent dehydrogenase
MVPGTAPRAPAAGAAMRRAVRTARGREVVTAAEPPGPPAGWVRLAVTGCGICGSDLHALSHDPGRRLGRTPGHEIAGTIAASGVAGLADIAYAISPNITCGQCEYCIAGRLNLCRQGGDGIGLGRDGGFADFVDAPAQNLFPVGPGAERVASLTEPLAVSLRAVHLARPEPGSRILVLGGGAIGQLCAVLARDQAGEVAITTRYEHQRALAERNGVTAIRPQDAVAWGKANRPGAVLETVGGSGETLRDGLGAVARGGRLVIVGSFGTVPVDIGAALFREVQILPSFAYASADGEQEFAAAARLLTRYRAELSALQTHEFELADIAAAVACAVDRAAGSVRVTVVPAGL